VARRFGRPEDFRAAIAELRVTFNAQEDTVTTDKGVLRTHGFSEGDYFSGALLFA
jgi:hypothetical protein